MWSILVVFLLGTFSTTAGFEVVVDGEIIQDEVEAITAMGAWGINLVTDSDKVNNAYQPASLGIKPKQIVENEQLSVGALGYLMKYGYFEVATQKTEDELLESDNLLSDAELRDAIKQFQKYYGLKVTGRPTPETLRKMSQARCGVKDMEYEPPSRAKRYATSRVKWGKHELTYWFDPTAWSIDMNRTVFRSEFEAALTMWANAAHVSFREVDDMEQADIKIGFYYGDHGDKYAFSGPGWELAHAFYPTKGKLHFDDAEPFTAGTVNGINFKFVALHEMGHILGIKHTDAANRDAIMYALYTGYSDDLKLAQDDIDAVIDRMGPGSGTVTPLTDEEEVEVTEAPTEVPDTPPDCIADIDAAIHHDTSPGVVYVFAGAWYYKLKPKRPDRTYNLPVLDKDFAPKRIGIDGFTNLPRKLDAAVSFLKNTNRFIAFKGETYHIYDFEAGNVVESGSLADLWPTDTPTKIDSALKLSSKKLGFLSGKKIYTYADGKYGVDEQENYFLDKYPHKTASTVTFYKDWVWIFQGSWYSIVRAHNGVASKNYTLRPIKNDIKLPMCAEEAGSLNTRDKKKCIKQLRTMRKKKGFKPSPRCLDFIAEKYKGEVVFDESDFE